jgi:hypothetical protein
MTDRKARAMFSLVFFDAHNGREACATTFDAHNGRGACATTFDAHNGRGACALILERGLKWQEQTHLISLMPAGTRKS